MLAMNQITFAALLFALVGVLYIGLGIPLLQGRIPPNRFYGSRTKKTLSDERIWYAVNRITGRDLIIGGVAVVITAIGIQFFGQSLDPHHARTILLTVLVVSVIVMVINSLLAERRM
jgi:uncharacterized membrane protein